MALYYFNYLPGFVKGICVTKVASHKCDRSGQPQVAHVEIGFQKHFIKSCIIMIIVCLGLVLSWVQVKVSDVALNSFTAGIFFFTLNYSAQACNLWPVMDIMCSIM